jgi:putative membrane protein
MLSALEEDRIEAAVAAAEDGTSGEIIVVLASEVSHYPDVALAYAAGVSLIIPPLALAVGVHPLAMAAQAGLWTVAQSGAREDQTGLALTLYAALQAALFIAVFLICEITAVRRALTPGVLKRHRVERAARQQFAAISSRAQDSQTGVLLFIALDDRQVRIEAAKGLHDKVGEAVWTRAARAIGTAMKAGHDPTAGIIEAVEICGAALKEHYPQAGPHTGGFSNRPVEI